MIGIFLFVIAVLVMLNVAGLGICEDNDFAVLVILILDILIIGATCFVVYRLT